MLRRGGLGGRVRGRHGRHPGRAAVGHGQGEAADVARVAQTGNGRLLQESGGWLGQIIASLLIRIKTYYREVQMDLTPEM